MATLLLIVIYLGFISLGLPDSVLGAAWPALHVEIGASVSSAGFISMVITAGTVISSLFSTYAIKRFGTGRVVWCSVMLTAAALLGFSFSDRLLAFCLLALPLGLGGGAIDAALNNYVSLHYSASHMSFLHAFWGVGATMGPILLSLAMKTGIGWRGGYRIISCIQWGLVLVMFFSLPLWKKLGGNTPEPEPDRTDRKPVLHRTGVVASMLCLLVYCAGEMSVGLWASSYFVNVRGLDAATAAAWSAAFFFGIMGGRLISGFAAIRLRPISLVYAGISVAIFGAAVLIIPLAPWTQLAGLILIGLGAGPVFPNLIHMTPLRFGRAVSQQVIGYEMAASYVGCSLMPPIFGLIAGRYGFAFLPPFVILCFVTLLVILTVLDRTVPLQKEAPECPMS